MARALLAVGIALALALVGLGLVVYLGHEPDAIAVDNVLAESITREIGTAEQRGADVRLADLTDFDWDHVLLAERRASHAEIAHALGGPWKGRLAFGTGDLLIFVHRGHVARYADYRGEGRFAGVPRPIARFARGDAVFSVRSLVIRPKRPAAPSSPSSPG
jgi:hypothetical protein